jgi:uncharacterized membrane protein
VNELITTYTALPNLHPALVHFPIALLPIAVLLDALLLGLPNQRHWLDRAASVLYVASALGAGAAYWAGRQAAESLPPLALHLQVHVNEHSDSGRAALWLLVLLAALRAAVASRDTRGRRKVLRLALLVIAMGAVGFVYRTADLGGGLVFQHGIGVAEIDDHGAAKATERKAEADAAGEDGTAAASRLVEDDDGSLTWKPLPGDRRALGTVLEPAPQTDDKAVSWVEPTDRAVGLGLAVDGEALLLLPGAFGDVQVQADLELEDFEGEVGLAHHVLSGSQAGLLTVSFPEHEFVLATRDGAPTRRLAGAVRPVPEGPFRLIVTAAGRHLHGLLGEERVVHGHRPPPPEGGAGLFLRGKGTVWILAVTIMPGGRT